MHFHAHALGLLLLTAGSPSFCAAQSPEPSPSPGFGPATPEAGCGLEPTDAGFRALGGRNFKAELTAAGLHFIPAWGPSAPDGRTLWLEFIGAGRSGVARGIPAQAEPLRIGRRRVIWRRGPCEERVDVSAGGLEQSFVFRRLPEGGGDLVVYQRLRAGLDEPARHRGGLRFVARDAHGLPMGDVRIGAVTGIDAEGRRAQGSMRLVDGVLEYRLPAQFVAAAALPLVLDPAIQVGQKAPPPPGTTYGGEQDVADLWAVPSGAQSDRVVAFTAFYSANDSAVLCAYVPNSSGPVDIVSVTSQSGGTVESDPSVASVGYTPVALVTYTARTGLDNDVRARAVVPRDFSGNITPVLSPEVPVAVGPGLQESARAMGARSPTDNSVRVIYFDQGALRLQRLFVTDLGSSLVLAPLATPQLVVDDPAFIAGNPEIQSVLQDAGGVGGIPFAVVWDEVALVGGNSSRVRVAIHNPDLTQLVAPQTLSDPARFARRPAVDGRDGLWTVAWQQDQPAGVAGFLDVHASTLRLDPPAGVVTLADARPISNIANRDESRPSVARLGEFAYITWQEPAGSFFDTTVVAVDPVAAIEFGRDTETNLGGVRVAGAEGAVSYFAGEARTGIGSQAEIVAGSLDGVAGSSFPVGGGCGVAGEALAFTPWSSPSPGVNNPAFGFSLLDGPANTTGWLVLSFTRGDLGCGPCRLVPDPYTGAVLPLTTDANGDARYPVILPAQITDLTFWCQWVMPVAGGTCPLTASGADFSAAVAVRPLP